MDESVYQRKENKTFISLQDSCILYGLAVVFMVFHHCFCIPERLDYNYIPVLGSFELEARIAYTGKLCVAFFAFISGYGFAQKCGSDNNLVKNFISDLRASIRSLLHFYSKLWFVAIIFIPIGIFFFGVPFDSRKFLRALFLGEGGYNGEWWYVRQYLRFLVVFPFLDLLSSFLKEKRQTKEYVFGIGIVLLSIGILQKAVPLEKVINLIKNLIISPYMLIFVMAFLIGKFNVFEYIDRKLQISSGISGLICFLLIIVRFTYTVHPSQNSGDIVIAPLLIFFIVKRIHFDGGKVKKEMKKTLKFMGKYSTFIWLSHTFWIYYYFQDIILLPHYSLLIFVWALFISLLNGILLDILYHKLNIKTLVGKITG